MEEKLIEIIKEAFKNVQTELVFLTQKDFREKLGWGKNTVAEMFNRKDFPSINLGKEKVIEISAFKEWAKKRRERGE